MACRCLSGAMFLFLKIDQGPRLLQSTVNIFNPLKKILWTDQIERHGYGPVKVQVTDFFRVQVTLLTCDSTSFFLASQVAGSKVDTIKQYVSIEPLPAVFEVPGHLGREKLWPRCMWFQVKLLILNLQFVVSFLCLSLSCWFVCSLLLLTAFAATNALKPRDADLRLEMVEMGGASSEKAEDPWVLQCHPNRWRALDEFAGGFHRCNRNYEKVFHWKDGAANLYKSLNQSL